MKTFKEINPLQYEGVIVKLGAIISHPQLSFYYAVTKTN